MTFYPSGFKMPPQSPASDHRPVWHTLSASAALQTLAVDANTGLSGEEVSRRLKQYGRNSLPASKRRGPWLRLALQFHNPLIYVLLVAGAITIDRMRGAVYHALGPASSSIRARASLAKPSGPASTMTAVCGAC